MAALAGALVPATALVLLAPGASAQEQALPSVSDYRLPAPQPRATRASGPVDPANPVVPVRREESSAAPAAPASAAASPAPARTASPAPRPAASASPSASPSRAAEPRRAETPARERADTRDRAEPRASEPRASEPRASETRASEPRPAESAEAASSPAPPASTPTPAASASSPVQWNVHSAKADGGTTLWPWLLGIAVLLASNLWLIVLLRRRQRKAEANWQGEETGWTQAEQPEAPLPPAAPVPAVAVEPEAPPPAPPQPAMAPIPAAAAPTPRPALELVAKPIEVTLAARQLSATLMNTVLNYELVVTNLSESAMGPIVIAGDMIGAHASLPARAQLEITGDLLEPHHRHALLHPGEWAKFSGQFRLPLAAITPIRSGQASLFVPLARFRVEVSRAGAPPLVVNRTFVIGETPDNPEAALKPFRLDLGPRLYSHIGQREVAATA